MWRRACGAALALATAAATMPGCRSAELDARDAVLRLDLDGVINPLSARYLERGLREAERDGAVLVLLRLDTPGGLESATREMVQAILGSAVPVAVWVAPPGARAASAGMFLTLAAGVAVMAPATNLGAAHPIGGDPRDETLAAKLTEDTAAFARSVAAARGRNADWAEEAVRKSVSITSEEALARGVIDLVVEGEGALLTALEGRTALTAEGPVLLRVAGARVVELPMSPPERVLHVIADPNVAYLLLTLGVLGLTVELLNPGTLVGGVVGAIALLLAFAALGTLPVNWAGVALVVLGIGLAVADLVAGGVGLLLVAGLSAFVLGSMILFAPFDPASPSMPNLAVSGWVVALTTAVLALLLLVVLRSVLRLGRTPVRAGMEALVGREGVAITDLADEGRVRVEGELWSARAFGETPIRVGDPVRVLAVSGVVLLVEHA